MDTSFHACDACSMLGQMRKHEQRGFDLPAHALIHVDIIWANSASRLFDGPIVLVGGTPVLQTPALL